MSSALNILKQMKLKQLQERYPTIPASYLPKPTYTDTTANGLSKSIIDFIMFSGGQAERISSEGRVIDKRTAVTDYLGNTKVIGSIKRVYASTTKGTADLSIVYRGLAIKCEVKVGADKMSEYQKQYQKQIEQAGGIYIIAKDFEGFYNWFNAKFGNNGK
jgi:hypothetical protein